MIPEINKILYVTDLSENSRHAFAYAASIANRYGAGVTVLHVMEEIPTQVSMQIEFYLGDDDWYKIRNGNKQELIDTIKSRLNKFCEEASNELTECPFITDETVVEQGFPSNVILDYARKGNFDLIVMGTHGHSAFVDAMMGGTTRRVLRLSRIPVLAVRLPE